MKCTECQLYINKKQNCITCGFCMEDWWNNKEDESQLLSHDNDTFVDSMEN